MQKLLRKLVGSKKPPRNHDRLRSKDKPFKVQVRRPNPNAAWVPAVPVDISAGGIGVFLPAYPGDNALEVELNFGHGHKVVVRAKPTWHVNVGHAVRVGLRLEAVPKDDWDKIRRFIGGQALELQNLAQLELKNKGNVDDLLRIVEKALLDQILQTLVEKKRLAPLESNREPLVQYVYNGATQLKGKVFHRLTIASKIVRDHKDDLRFRTVFVIDGSNGHFQVR